MKSTVFSGVVVLAMAMLLAFCGIVSADVLPFQVPETQGIQVVTAVVANGNVVHTDDLAWQLTTGFGINSPPLMALPGTLTLDGAGNAVLFPRYNILTGAGEIAMVNAYRDTINAQAGMMSLQKTVGINTANQVAIENNVQISKNMEFTSIAGAASRVVEDEEAMIDNMGQAQATANVMLCPFGAGMNAVIPMFCNRVTMGSALDMTDVSVASEVFSRSVAATADVPASLRYTINVKGPQSTAVAGTPAVAKGTVTARMNAHIMEGRAFGPFVTGATGPPTALPAGLVYMLVPSTPSEDVQYSTETTAAGEIQQFVKSMSYSSGMRR